MLIESKQFDWQTFRETEYVLLTWNDKQRSHNKMIAFTDFNLLTSQQWNN